VFIYKVYANDSINFGVQKNNFIKNRGMKKIALIVAAGNGLRMN